MHFVDLGRFGGKGRIGFVRFFGFGFNGVARIVTWPDFLDFLVTFRDITFGEGPIPD